MQPNQTIFLGGLVRLDFKGNEKINVSFYVSNELYIHRTKTIHADEIFRSQVTKLLVPPFTDEEKEKIDNVKNLDFEITKACNLFLSGIGFVHLVSLDAKVTIKIFKMIDVEIRNDD